MGLKQLMEKHIKGRKTLKRTESAPLSFREMEHILNSTAISLFEKYRAELIEKPPVYIVPAVWGEKKSGDLDATQKEIHRTLSPVLEDVYGKIGEFEADSHEGRCIDYLLKGLVLYKMAYMAQYYMNKKGYAALLSMEEDSFLADMEPAGMA
jgi:hypothetical protein